MKTITFNGQTLPAWLWIIKEPLHAAPISWSYMQRKTGAAPTKQYIGPAELPYEVKIMADSEADLYAKAEILQGMLYTTEPKILTRSSEPGRQYLALWDKNEAFSKLFETGEGEITFVIPGGLKDSTEKTSANFTTGITLNLAGTYKTFPKFEVTFTAAATNYQVAHETKGQLVKVLRSFALNDKLVIDHEKEFITLNGVNIMPSLAMESRFFSLDPGANKLVVTASNHSSKAIYKEKYV